MTHAPAEVAIEYEIADAPVRRPLTSPRLRGILLLAPAVVVAILFSIIPLGYLFQVSLTRESSFFFTAEYTGDNYQEVFTRYRSAIVETVYLAGVSSILDLVFGYPFAYILIRKIRYREFVRTMMTFPLFGPLYLAFGSFTSSCQTVRWAPFSRCLGSTSPGTCSPRPPSSSRWRCLRFPSW